MGSTGTLLLRALGLVGAGGGVSLAAVYQPVVLLCAGAAVCMVVVSVVFGVMLPAVWSRKSARRRAAASVFDRLLTAIRPSVPSREIGLIEGNQTQRAVFVAPVRTQ